MQSYELLFTVVPAVQSNILHLLFLTVGCDMIMCHLYGGIL